MSIDNSEFIFEPERVIIDPHHIVVTATYGDAKSGQPFEQNAYIAFALPEIFRER